MTNEFDKACETVAAAVFAVIVSAGEHRDNLPDLFADITLPAPVLAQLLMNHLPADNERIGNKAFWLDVAEHMGPDYVAGYRHVAGFMNKVGEF